MEQAEEVVPLALMALGLDPNTGNPADLAKAKKLLMRIRPGVTTITSSNYIDDASAGKIILGQGWNGDVRRVAQARKKQGDITVVVPDGRDRALGRQLVHHARTHPTRWRRTPGSTTCSTRRSPRARSLYHNYAIPIAKMWALPGAKALAERPDGQHRPDEGQELQVHPQPDARPS